MKKIKLIIILLLPLLFIRCGKPDVNVNDAAYEPKIAVEAYLYANEPVNNIKIMRNYPLNVQIDFNKLYLTPVENSVQVAINGVPLQFDPVTKTYNDLNTIIEPGKTYRLTVSAIIDGKNMHAEAATTVPMNGFKILNAKNLGSFKYGDESINLQFNPSPGSDLYVFSFLAKTAGPDNFIFDNQYLTDIDTNDVLENIADYRYKYDAISDVDAKLGNIYTFSVLPYNTWFYTSYRSIIYAGDTNFRNFLFSATNVKEPDGNFHEPIKIFSGDAIGVFASAIRDTVEFRIDR